MAPSVKARKAGVDLQFLGSGNAFSSQGRSYNAFIVNNRYLFDAGPGVMPQMAKARLDTAEINSIFISHFHADHFFGLPFLYLDYWMNGRKDDLYLVGPPGLEERAENLFELAFPGLPPRNGYRRRYTEVEDGQCGEVPGLEFQAAEVEHVPSLRCFGFSARVGGRTLMYSGDSILCPGLMTLAENADILVLDCNCGGDPVHLSQRDIAHVRSKACEDCKTIVTHLDAEPTIGESTDILFAADLRRFRF